MIVEKSNKDYSKIDLDLLKQQLNFDLDYTDEDAYLNQLLTVATDYCEGVLGFDIVPTDNTITINEFCRDYVVIDEGNLIEITSITLDGEELTDYSVYKKYYSFKIDFKRQIRGDLVVNFKTGYENDIKPKHLQAILIKASDLYDAERQSYTYNLNKNDVLKYLLTL